MQEELDFLSNRVMEANVFFTGRLLAPAMPRIDDKSVRFALIRDENGARSRMRFLMPFTVEKPGFPSVPPSSVAGPTPSALSARRWSIPKVPQRRSTIFSMRFPTGKCACRMFWYCRMYGLKGLCPDVQGHSNQPQPAGDDDW